MIEHACWDSDGIVIERQIDASSCIDNGMGKLDLEDGPVIVLKVVHFKQDVLYDPNLPKFLDFGAYCNAFLGVRIERKTKRHFKGVLNTNK